MNFVVLRESYLIVGVSGKSDRPPSDASRRRFLTQFGSGRNERYICNYEYDEAISTYRRKEERLDVAGEGKGPILVGDWVTLRALKASPDLVNPFDSSNDGKATRRCVDPVLVVLCGFEGAQKLNTYVIEGRRLTGFEPSSPHGHLR